MSGQASPDGRTLIILLDVDGPVIPATQMLVDPMSSWDRIVPTTTVAVLSRLCERTGAKIVFNSTHNDPWEWAPDIVDALVRAGLDRSHVHPTHDRTAYPAVPRAQAAAEWLAAHPEVDDWIAFDDVAFIDDPRLIWVDPEAGLHLGHLNKALVRFGARPIFIGI